MPSIDRPAGFPRALTLAILMLSASLGALPAPSGAQEEPFDLTVGASTYDAGQTVRFDLANNMDQDATAHLNLLLDTCGTAPCSDPPSWDHVVSTDEGEVTIPAQSSIEVTWDQTGKDDQQVPDGVYRGRAVLYNETYGNTTAYSNAFQIGSNDGSDDTTSDDDPVAPVDVRILSPGDGEHFQDRFVPFEIEWRSEDRIDTVNVFLDGDRVFHESGIGSRAYNVSQIHEIPQGTHYVYANAETEPNATGYAGDGSANHTFYVEDNRTYDDPYQDDNDTYRYQNGSDPGFLQVRTDQGFYGPDRDQVHVTVRNPHDEPIEGSVELRVTHRQHGLVWSDTPSGSSELAPNATERFTWDRVTDDGSDAPRGDYRVTVTWGEARGSAPFHLGAEMHQPPQPPAHLRLRFASPGPGSAQQGEVGLELRASPPGVTHLELRVSSPQTQLEVTKNFTPAREGSIDHTLDLADAPSGFYHVRAMAQGPNGTMAHTSTWFRLDPGEDTRPPTFEVLHPRDGDSVPRVFPVVVRAEDDVGLRYAEAYVDGELVSRHDWRHPVLDAAFPVHLPQGVSGSQEVRIVVYDEGDHEASATVDVDVLTRTSRCEEALERARTFIERHRANETSADGPRSEVPDGLHAAARFDCPKAREALEEAIESGVFRYHRDENGSLADVQVQGRQVFERISPQDTDDRRTKVRVNAQGDTLVVEGEAGGRLSYDLNGTWVASKRGQHVLLENTQTGDKILLAVVGGSQDALGKRLVTELTERGHVVARPVGDGASDGELADAILDGFVGAEVSVSSANGSSETVTYSEMNVTVSVADDRVAATVSTEQHEGRTLVFTLDEDTSVGEEVQVILDGEELRQADSLQDVLNPHDDDEQSEYYVVTDDGERKVIVSVGHFSTRQLVIQAAEFAGPFITPVAVVGGIAVVGVATLGLFRKKDG